MNKETNRIVAQQFNEMLDNTGLRVNYASEKLGIAKQTVSSWKNGKFFFSTDTLKRIKEFIDKMNEISKQF